MTMRRRLFDPNLVSGLTPHRDVVRLRIVAEQGPAALKRIQREETERFHRDQIAQAEAAVARCTDDENRARCQRNLDWARGELEKINAPLLAAE
jgi:hypothetical protein